MQTLKWLSEALISLFKIFKEPFAMANTYAEWATDMCVIWGDYWSRCDLKWLRRNHDEGYAVLNKWVLQHDFKVGREWLTFIPMGNLLFPINLSPPLTACLWTVRGSGSTWGEPKQTCKTHTEIGGIEPRPFMLWDNSDNHQAHQTPWKGSLPGSVGTSIVPFKKKL